MELLDERMIRLARLPPSLRPVPIYSGDPPAPIPCEWLGVARVRWPEDDREPEDREAFILYFLDRDGRARELLQYETLRIALDQAHYIVGYPRDQWTTCDVPVLADGGYSVSALTDAVRGRV